MDDVLESPTFTELAALGVHGGVESPAVRLVQEAKGPLRSFARYVGYRLSGGRIARDTATFFEKHEEAPRQEVPIADCYRLLGSIDKKLSGSSSAPEEFIGDLCRDWVSIQDKIRTTVGNEAVLTDYVYFDPKKDTYQLFFIRNNKLCSVAVHGPITSNDELIKQIREPLLSADCPNDLVQLPGQTPFAQIQNNVNLELIIAGLLKQSGDSEGRLRRLSPITNDFPYMRNVLIEREGEIFTRLRHLGVWKLGELQSVNRLLFSKGIYFDPDKGDAVTDPDLAQMWYNIRSVSLGTSDPTTREQLARELNYTSRETLYFRMISEYLEDESLLIQTFVKSDFFLKNALFFKDRYLASVGATELAVAKAMLANYYLFKFEGGADMASSPSQRFLASIPGYKEGVEEFVDSYQGYKPPLPEVKPDKVGQKEALQQLAKEWGERLRDQPFSRLTLSLEEKKHVLEEAEVALPIAKQQIQRNKFHQAALDYLDEKTSLIIDPYRRKGVFSVLIANLGLAKAPGDRFTIASWFPRADGYYPDGPNLPDIPEVIPSHPVETALRQIFSGGKNTAEGYDEQVKRIIEEAPRILQYLQYNPDVPDNVRSFIKTVGSPELAVRVLERFGSIGDQDPNIVNRFFPEGFVEFQKMALYRYIHDFIRGVETNLIFAKNSPSESLRRRFSGQWQNNDFSTLSDEQVRTAIKKTLATGSHRIRLLNHEQGVKRRTLSDYQEFLERMFGWDTLDMSFLRWEKLWNIWNTLGGAWDCICFSRKTVFNAPVLQQY